MEKCIVQARRVTLLAAACAFEEHDYGCTYMHGSNIICLNQQDVHAL